MLFVIRMPSGRYVRAHADEPDPEAIGLYPSGTWTHIVEQPYERGRYEVRAYVGQPLVELARSAIDVGPGSRAG
jgi:hypothetical protein